MSSQWGGDLRRLYAAAFLRAVATGMAGILLGVDLARLGLGAGTVGLVVAAGLAGAALASLLATFGADALGRRRFLTGLLVLSAGGGVAAALVTSPTLLAAAAFFGMLNGMGRDRGAALILEQAALPATTSEEGRTRVFAVYNVLQDAGHALGSLLAAAPAVVSSGGALASHRLGFGVYAALALAGLPLVLGLSPAVESPSRRSSQPVSPETRRVLWRVAPLFALDSLGGGFLTTALLAFFFHERFGVGEATLGPLFFGARVGNALSHLAAAWLARRIGLLNTMVFTHVPSSVLLVTLALAPSFPVAALLFLLREGLVEMDVPTRQSYVMAVVRPEERTLASGLTHLVRMGAWAVAPALAGLVMQRLSLLAPLLAGAALKLVYDVLLYLGFRRTLPPEEGGGRDRR